MAELRASVSAAVTAEQLWTTITDWPGQSRWIPLTTAALTAGPEGVGAEVEAWTGIGPVGFLDTMVIEVWDPPHHLVLLHTGKVVKGRAGFDITRDGSASRLEWWEDVEPPLGPIGRAGWPVAAAVAHVILRWCLRRVVRLAARA